MAKRICLEVGDDNLQVAQAKRFFNHLPRGNLRTRQGILLLRVALRKDSAGAVERPLKADPSSVSGQHALRRSEAERQDGEREESKAGVPFAGTKSTPVRVESVKIVVGWSMPVLVVLVLGGG